MLYKDYLKSNQWLKKKNQVKYWHGHRCLICRKKRVDIHHKTYKRIFNEDKKIDLVPLCRKHHFGIHDLSKETGEHIWNITTRLVDDARKGIKTWKKMTVFEREKYLGKGL